MSYLLNGVLYQQDDLLLPIKKNGSFWYGDGFFETMKYANDSLFFAQQHWNRIVKTCTLLQVINPFADIQHFKTQVNLLAATQASPIQKIKLICWRNTYQAYQPETNALEYLFTSDHWDDLSYNINDKGITLSIYTDHLKSTSSLGNIKSTSSQLYVLAAGYAKNQQTEDCILLNTHGNLVETSRSNLWLVDGDTIYTPPLSEGCLAGVMRQVLIEICHQENLKLVELPISPGLLDSCQEVFISNSLRGVQWVGSVANRIYKNPVMAKHLAHLLNEKVKPN